MPPELTKAKFKRKMGRREMDDYRFDGGHAREIEQKRNSGQISCAECRRLKIKCDKQIPCQSCQRRGCAALCPNGSLSTGQGTRFVLAATEHLHRRIAKMSERIRLLEDALGDLQAQHSTEPHPLLREELLGVHHKDDRETPPPDEPGATGHPPELLDAFGTLSITDHGISRFFGPTGGSESDNVSPDDGADTPPPNSTRDSGTPLLHQDLRLFSQAFPFTPMGSTGAVRELIEAHLPNWERASYLSQMYSEQAGWLFHCVSKDQIVDELLPLYYSNGPVKATNENKNVHDLALLFLVFAVGALVDVSQDTSNTEAEHYHQIARAAICLQPVLEKPSLVTIQSLHMLSFYNAMSGNELSGKETSMETTWSLIVLAAHLAQTIGLHRDSMRWDLPEKIVQRRRLLFWDLFVADAWESLNTGRPPCFSLAYIDCRYPGHVDRDSMDTEANLQFDSWTYRFAAECVAEVASRTLTAEIPSYATIMELDRKVREFPIPEDAETAAASVDSLIPTNNALEELPLPEAMGRFVMSNAREVILLYIHRCFFAQAIIENPVNPLKSQYAQSFLTTYRASTIILRTIRAHYANHPQLCSRFWSLWTFAFSAAIVFGTIVTRGPRSPLASNAIKELDEACVLFTKAAVYSRRAAKALPILTKLSEKAHSALAAAQSERASPGQMGQHWSVTKGERDADELAIFAGRTRFVSTRRANESSKQTPEGSQTSGYPTYTNGHSGPASSQYYSTEGSASSVDVDFNLDQWAAPAEHDQIQPQPLQPPSPPSPPPPPPPQQQQQQQYSPDRNGPHAQYIASDAGNVQPQPQVMPEWRPPRRSHYSYGPQEYHGAPRMSTEPAPQTRPQSLHGGLRQHTGGHRHDHGAATAVTMTAATSAYPWAPDHFSNTASYGGSSSSPSASGSTQSHGYPGHGHHHTHARSHSHPHTTTTTTTHATHAQQHPRTYEPAVLPPMNAYPPPPVPPPPIPPPSSSLQPVSTPVTAAPPLAPLSSLMHPPHAAPSELTDLGLVSHESRLDERWTSFMRDSGYFEGFGYRNR